PLAPEVHLHESDNLEVCARNRRVEACGSSSADGFSSGRHGGIWLAFVDGRDVPERRWGWRYRRIRSNIRNMSVARRRISYSVAEYTELEDYSNVRHELLDGQILAMSGGTPEHATYCANVIAL